MSFCHHNPGLGVVLGTKNTFSLGKVFYCRVAAASKTTVPGSYIRVLSYTMPLP